MLSNISIYIPISKQFIFFQIFQIFPNFITLEYSYLYSYFQNLYFSKFSKLFQIIYIFPNFLNCSKQSIFFQIFPNNLYFSKFSKFFQILMLSNILIYIPIPKQSIFFQIF